MAKAKKSKFKLVINWKKFIISSIAVFVAMFVTDYVIHSQLMMDLYTKHAAMFRSMNDMHGYMNYMLAAQILFSLFFVFLYSQGYSGGKTSLAEGLRYGLYVGLLIGIPHHLGMHAWSLYPLQILEGWALGCVAQSIVLGGVVGLTYSHK